MLISNVRTGLKEEIAIAAARTPNKESYVRMSVCKLRCWKQREAVLKKARKSKPSGLFISEDLALATLQRRAAQVGKLREAKQAGKITYFVLDRLVIRDKKIPPNHDV